MSAFTVNISFQGDLLDQIDQIAKKEARSRSELIREATRMYVERKQRWQNIFRHGEEIAQKNKISEEDIMAEIKSYRKGQ
jgi:metal-responsive CopG/Arc/MetJ family transcriptional regulator